MWREKKEQRPQSKRNDWNRNSSSSSCGKNTPVTSVRTKHGRSAEPHGFRSSKVESEWETRSLSRAPVTNFESYELNGVCVCALCGKAVLSCADNNTNWFGDLQCIRVDVECTLYSWDLAFEHGSARVLRRIRTMFVCESGRLKRRAFFICLG